MTPTEQLLHHIRCKQLLLCVYQSETDGQITLTDVTSLLDIDSAGCIALVRRLQFKGLVEPRPGGDLGSIQLTAKGQRLIARMTRAAVTPPELAPGEPSQLRFSSR